MTRTFRSNKADKPYLVRKVWLRYADLWHKSLSTDRRQVWNTIVSFQKEHVQIKIGSFMVYPMLQGTCRKIYTETEIIHKTGKSISLIVPISRKLPFKWPFLVHLHLSRKESMFRMLWVSSDVRSSHNENIWMNTTMYLKVSCTYN